MFSHSLACIVATLTLAATTTASAAANCDRACLLDINSKFNAALVKHSAKGLPVAANLRATQNVQPLALGEGVWKTASPIRTSIDMADPESGQVATLGFFYIDKRPAYFLSRLKVVDRKITESEFFWARRGDTIYFNPEDPTRMDDYINEVVPAALRSSRADLIKMAEENVGTVAGKSPTVLKRAAKVRGGENGYDVPPPTGGMPGMPGAPRPGKVIMERDSDEGSSTPVMQEANFGMDAGPAPGGASPTGLPNDGMNAAPPAGMGGGPAGQPVREVRVPLVDTERGLALAYFFMGGKDPKPGEVIDWNKYYGQPDFKEGDTVVIPNRSTYRIFLTKVVNGDMTMDDKYEVEVPPHVLTGFGQ